MRGEGGVLQRVFIYFFTMKPVFPPAPVFDYSSEGASKHKLTSWAVIVSFLVSYLLIMVLGILAITVPLLIIGISEGPAFSISSIMIEAILIPMILLFIYKYTIIKKRARIKRALFFLCIYFLLFRKCCTCWLNCKV